MSVRNADDLLVELLQQARARYDNGDDFGAYTLALGGVNQYLYRLGMPYELMVTLDSLRNLVFDGTRRVTGKSGRKQRASEETSAFADGAAVVTVLKERGWKVADAIKKVAVAANLDAKKLKSFRDNINRGLHDEYTRFLYPEVLKFRRSQTSLSDTELIKVLIPRLRQKRR